MTTTTPSDLVVIDDEHSAIQTVDLLGAALLHIKPGLEEQLLENEHQHKEDSSLNEDGPVDVDDRCCEQDGGQNSHRGPLWARLNPTPKAQAR